MINRILSLLSIDLKLLWRNYFFHIILLLAVIFVVVINFAIPNKPLSESIEKTEYFYDGTGGLYRQSVVSVLLGEGKSQEDIDALFFDSEEELLQTVNEDNNSYGLSVKTNLAGGYDIKMIIQGTEGERNRQLARALMDKFAQSDFDYYSLEEGYEIEYLGNVVDDIPANVNAIPLLMSLEVVALGFFLVAVLIFQEKQQGIHRFYSVTPSGVFEYIASKTLSNVSLSMVYGITILVGTLGVGGLNLSILGLVAITATMMTWIGLILSVFFRDISEFMFTGVIAMAWIGLPNISYMLPSFSPAYMSWIPSYILMFGMREILYPTGTVIPFSQYYGILLAQLVVIGAIAYWAVSTKLLREVK